MSILFYIAILLSGLVLFLLYRIYLLSRDNKNQKHTFQEKIESLNIKLKESDLRFENQEKKIKEEKQKIKTKNQKLWKLSETVYKEKKQVDEDNKKLTINQGKYKKKIQKLWEQSTSIHKEKERINKIKKEIEAVYKEVSDSINYAQRIQASILPESNILKKHLSEHFVLFKPKDKVSGDFYWWTHIGHHTIITAADCTGHGVPGAFMSMLGASFLREVIEKEYITHTGVILRKLRKEIIKALKQTNEAGTQKDGMDMALISIDHETNIVQFSGANNPLYIIRNVITSERGNLPNNDELIMHSTNAHNDGLILAMTYNEKGLYEIKPDKMPIAIYEKMDAFTTHEFQLEKGDMLYMFSDGFADQFGGPKGKKFKYKPFKRLLLENAYKPMVEQKEIMNQAFESWRGKEEQIDDVVVLGIKI